jgi:hypothetical protein
MRDAPPTVACPNGHPSIDPVLCSVCGTWLAGVTQDPRNGGGTSGSTPTMAPNAAPVSPSATSPSSDASALAGTDAGRTGPAASGAECPNCSCELDAGTHFCEVCGYDPATGTLPSAPVAQPVLLPPAAPPAPLTAASGMPDPSLVRPSRPATTVRGRWSTTARPTGRTSTSRPSRCGPTSPSRCAPAIASTWVPGPGSRWSSANSPDGSATSRLGSGLA